jgi:hypothetical protein
MLSESLSGGVTIESGRSFSIGRGEVLNAASIKHAKFDDGYLALCVTFDAVLMQLTGSVVTERYASQCSSHSGLFEFKIRSRMPELHFGAYYGDWGCSELSPTTPRRFY